MPLSLALDLSLLSSTVKDHDLKQSDIPSGKTRMMLCLQNTGDETLSNWQLHMDLPREVSAGPNTLLQPRIGCHLVLSPSSPDNKQLAAGESCALALEGDAPLLQRLSDLPNGLYLESDNGRGAVNLRNHNLATNNPVSSVSVSAVTPDLNPVQSLIPAVNAVTEFPGGCQLPNDVVIYADSNASQAHGWLSEILQPHHRLGSGTFEQAHIRFICYPELNLEAYTLEIQTAQITLKAASQQGFCRAVATLIQLLDQSRADHSALPCLVIDDEPRFAYRALMLDCVRHFHSLDTVLHFVDWLARYKFNHFHWHLTDDEGWRLPIKALPALTEIGAWRGADDALISQFGSGAQRYGGFYSHEDIATVLAYAQQRGITVVPEIDIPGHCRAALASLPELLKEPEDRSQYCSVQFYNDNVLNPALPGTYQFLETVLAEVCALFPSPYIHMGADEVPEGVWTGSPACQQMMTEQGYSEAMELQAHLLRHVQDFLQQRGRTLLGWEEAAHGNKLDHSAVICAWTGEQAIGDVTAMGYSVISCPAPWGYHDLAWNNDINEPGFYWAGTADLESCYRHSPCPDSLNDDQQSKVIGVQGNFWCELIATPERLQYMAFPRVFATAENAWGAEQEKDWPSFEARAKVHLARLAERGVMGRTI